MFVGGGKNRHVLEEFSKASLFVSDAWIKFRVTYESDARRYLDIGRWVSREER